MRQRIETQIKHGQQFYDLQQYLFKDIIGAMDKKTMNRLTWKMGNPKHKQILSKKNFLLEGQLFPFKLTVKLIIYQPIQDMGQYVGEIKSIAHHPKLEAVCRTLPLAFNFLDDEQNFRIDTKQKCLHFQTNHKDKVVSFFKLKLSKVKMQEVNQPKKICASKWVNKQWSNFLDLQISGNNIKSFCPSGCAYAFSTLIFSSTKFKFVVKIVENMKIGIGIADKKNTTKVYLSHSYIYYDNCGRLFTDGELDQNNQTFQSGDVVSVLGDFNTQIIEFKVNKETVIRKRVSRLNDDVSWVPFVKLWRGSCVSILHSSFPEVSMINVYFAKELFDWDYDVLYEINQIVKASSATKDQNEQQEKNWQQFGQ